MKRAYTWRELWEMMVVNVPIEERLNWDDMVATAKASHIQWRTLYNQAVCTEAEFYGVIGKLTALPADKAGNVVIPRKKLLEILGVKES